MNYIQDSEDFCEADFFMLQKLSARIDLVIQKSKIQANISKFMAPLVEQLKLTNVNDKVVIENE